MLAVITTIVYEASLLPHFLDHYKHLGVNRFIIGTHPQIHDTVRNMVANQPVELFPISFRMLSTGVEGNNKDELRQEAKFTRNDWLIPADLDEFNQYVAPPLDLIARAEAENVSHYRGKFADRLSFDGTLSLDHPLPSIWEQYPLEADISQRLVQGCTDKVTLVRGDQSLSAGHHTVEGVDPAPISCTVHHFKWRAGVLDALQRRINCYQEQGIPWWVESKRVLDYFSTRDKFDLTDFETRLGWFPPWLRG